MKQLSLALSLSICLISLGYAQSSSNKKVDRIHQVFTYAAPEGAPLKQDYDVFVYNYR